LFRVFSDNPDPCGYLNIDREAVKVSLALRSVIESTHICSTNGQENKEEAWRVSFMAAVCEVLTGFREERPLLASNKISMHAWMRLRIITISGKLVPVL
jgi:hypothetical protein